MSIISRFTDIMKANINSLLDKCEDPAKMIDQTLRDLNENLAEVKQETAGVIAEETRAKRTYDAKAAEAEKWDGYARKAVVAGNDNDAREFLAKKTKATAEEAEAKKVYDIASANADKMRQMHNKLVNDINELESRRETIKAKAAVAKTQENMNKITAGTDAGSTLRKFDDIESRIDKRLDAAMAMEELNAPQTDAADALADKYDNGAKETDIDAQLAALKAEMGV